MTKSLLAIAMSALLCALQGSESIETLLINGVLVFGGRTASVLLGGLWGAHCTSIGNGGSRPSRPSSRTAGIIVR